jgi:lysophospholipase L1-like esterase
MALGWARLIVGGSVAWAIALGSASAAEPAPVRPRTGAQLYVQRVVALQAGQLHGQLPASSFAAQWQGAWPQPTHQQWLRLLSYEAWALAQRQGQRPVTVLIGDSLLLWVPPEQLPGDRLWLNQSISGETTADMVQRLGYVAPVRPTTLVIMAGVNDLKQGQDPAVVVSNLELLVQRLRRQHGRSRLVVLSVLPTRLPQVPPATVENTNRRLAIALGPRGAEFIDLQPAFSDPQGWLRPELTTDGLHLNAQGYSLLTAYLARL